MGMPRYAAKVDSTQAEIVKAVRDDGWDCHLQRTPCDLFCYHPVLDIWATLECKPLTGKREPKPRVREAEQDDQAKFCERTGTPYVSTADQAVEALRERVRRHCEMFRNPSAIQLAKLIASGATV